MANIPVNLLKQVTRGDYNAIGEVVDVAYFLNTPLHSQVFITQPMGGGSSTQSYQFYIAATEDVPNNIFESFQDGLDYFDSDVATVIFSKLNANENDPNFGVNTYVMGDLEELHFVIQSHMDEKADKTTTVNGHALSSNVTVSKSDVGLGNCDNTSDTNKPVSSATQTALNGKQATITTGTTAQYFRGDLSLATFPNLARTFNTPTRSLNSAFQISTTQDAVASYSVDIATTLSLTGGQTGTVFLEYADDSGHTTNVKEVARFVNGNTGTLTIGLNITQNVTGTLTGMIPAGKYVKIRTANTAGSPSFTYRSAQEVLF